MADRNHKRILFSLGKCRVCKKNVYMHSNYIYINKRICHVGCAKEVLEDGK